jgi:hypothetical protein
VTLGRPPAIPCAHISQAMRPRPSHCPMGDGGSVTRGHAAGVHSPPWQTCPAAQATLHAPQWEGETSMRTHTGHVSPGSTQPVLPGGQLSTH